MTYLVAWPAESTIAIEAAGRQIVVSDPIRVRVSGAPMDELAATYSTVDARASGVLGTGSIAIGGATIQVIDHWHDCDGDVLLDRRVRVRGAADGGFLTRVAIPCDVGTDWASVDPFVPGVAYGPSMPVAEAALLGWPARRSLTTGLVREDRAAAPLFAVRGGSGRWLAVLHDSPEGASVTADGAVEDGGDILIDERLRFASLGGVAHASRLDIGVAYPGTEGEYTYSCGDLPLKQLAGWRWRFHPLRDGLVQHYRVRIRLGTSDDWPAFYRDTWRWAWGVLRPQVSPVDADVVLAACGAVLAGQVCGHTPVQGIPLEVDAVSDDRTGLRAEAIMGFVGANTDAAYLLLRLSEADAGIGYEKLGRAIVDSFTCLRLDPPEGEGFDLATGAATTYRTYLGQPAVYARSVAEGCLAVLRASQWTDRRGDPRPQWLAWARSGAEWLAGAQHPDGSIDRAWVADTGAPIDPSPTASHVVVPFLTEIARTTGDDRYLECALRAAEFSWQHGGAQGCFAGATLDNPDVVDKEAAVIAAEGYLDLHDATGDASWLARAEVAASIAETWVYIWSVPMPDDADERSAHWKRGVATIGHQLIATGVSMADGFLAMNAAVWARLYRATGDNHYLEVARLVTHGTKAMLALPGRTYDLRGPGWQQEHWSFAVRRGYGLNRRWLPWVEVAHLGGIVRLKDLGADLARAVLDPNLGGAG
jgi:hypothetical protein